MLNSLSIKIFNEKSFNTIAFKYLRFMTYIDLLICLLLAIYCLLCHTTPFSSLDLYLRRIYLVYVYIPVANMASNLTMLITVLVTIERLVAIRWPTKKHKLFSPTRYFMSCVAIMIIALLFNIIYFFLYRIECTPSSIEPMPNSFTMWTSWIVYGYFKEVLMRIVPITFLVQANILLILKVKSSRAKMATKKQATTATSAAEKKRSRQDSQLTIMTIFVAFMYSVCSVPMIFAFPGLVFKDMSMTTYKVYAAAVNILALSQSAFRFLIYFCFTTKFRLVFKKNFCFCLQTTRIPTPTPTRHDDKETEEHQLLRKQQATTFEPSTQPVETN